MDDNMSILSILDIDETEELDVFRYSAKVCIVREALINHLKKLNLQINERKLTDDEYYRQQYARYLPDRGFGLWGPLIVGAMLLFGCLGQLIDWPIVWFALCSIGVIAFAVYVKKKDKEKAHQKAQISTAQYRLERIEHQKKVEKWKEESISWKEMIGICTRILNMLSVSREAIPEMYWNRAAELLFYVDNKRADNLKEALRVMADEDFFGNTKRMIGTLADKVQQARNMVSDMQAQIDRMDVKIAQAELNSDLNTLITLAAIYDSRN